MQDRMNGWNMWYRTEYERAWHRQRYWSHISLAFSQGYGVKSSSNTSEDTKDYWQVYIWELFCGSWNLVRGKLELYIKILEIADGEECSQVKLEKYEAPPPHVPKPVLIFTPKVPRLPRLPSLSDPPRPLQCLPTMNSVPSFDHHYERVWTG